MGTFLSMVSLAHGKCAFVLLPCGRGLIARSPAWLGSACVSRISPAWDRISAFTFLY